MTIYKIIMEQRQFVGVWRLLRPHLHMFVCQSLRVLWYIILETAINYFILSYNKCKVYIWSHHPYPVLNTTFWDGGYCQMKNILKRQHQVMMVCIKLPRKKKGFYISWYQLSGSGIEILLHSVIWTSVCIVEVLLHMALGVNIVCLYTWMSA